MLKSLRFKISIVLSVVAVSVSWPGLLQVAGAAIPSFMNWGLFNLKGKSHIDVLDAWKLERGSKNVVVAVIDTGIDPNHPALATNLWHDVSESKPALYGWNFVSDTPNPTDVHGHGTHVSGIIGAVSDFKLGIAGVAQHVSIMPVKYYSDSNPGTVNLKNTIRAINFAIDHGAQIINYSGGGPEFSEDEYLAIKRAEAKGILVVAAAGNDRHDTDLVENYYYPSAYRLSNIISVAATDIRNDLLQSSNWGKNKVDVAAPGENIYSTLPGNKYGYMSGTSQATAFVTGMAALLLSHDPTLKPAQIKELIVGSVDQIPGLKSKIMAQGRVNAYSALLALQAKKGKTVNTLHRLPANGPIPLMNLIAEPVSTR